MFLPTTLTVTAILAYLFYRYVLHPAFISPLSKLPAGHPSAHFSPIWIWWNRNTCRNVRPIFAAHQRHGPIVRLAPNEVSVASLEGLRKIYSGGSGFERSDWFLQFRNYDKTPNLVTLFDPKQHATRRRMVSHIYSKSYLFSCVDFHMLSQILIYERLFPLLDDAARTGQTVDMWELSSAIGAEFMTAYEVGTGNCMDIIRKGKEHERRVYVENGKEKLMGTRRSKKAAKALEEQCLEMCKNTERFLESSSFASKEKKGKVHDENTGSSLDVEERSKSASTYPIVYAQLRDSIPAKEHPKDLQETLRLIASEFLDNIEAARLGMGIALTYAMYELSLHPSLQSSLRKELMTLETPLSYPPRKGILSTSVFRQLDGFPLLDAVLTETLRVHVPSIPLHRRVPQGGAVIEGYFIPAGVTINTTAYCLHRNEIAYPEPNEWKPERWLEIREAAVGQGHRDDEDGGELEKGKSEDDPRRWFWAFGSGGKMCIGNNFALIGKSSWISYTPSMLGAYSPADSNLLQL